MISNHALKIWAERAQCAQDVPKLKAHIYVV